MFRPRCSQQQISVDIRLCSRCGFQLNVVKALPGVDDYSWLKSSKSIAAHRSRGKRDLTIGALWMGLFALHCA